MDLEKNTSNTTPKRLLMSALLTISQHHCFYNLLELNLSRCNLIELPDDFNLPTLRRINISYNLFESPPSCFYNRNFVRLEFIDMSCNVMSQFYKPPDCFENLRILILNCNKFMEIPHWIDHVEELDFSQNRITDSIHRDWKLKKLILRNTLLRDNYLLLISHLETLKYLDIGNELQDEEANLFINVQFNSPLLNNLEILKLDNVNLGYLPNRIYKLSALCELYLSENSLTKISNSIEALSNLQILDVSKNSLFELPKLSKLTKLRVLLSSYNYLDEIPIIPDSVEVLDLYDNYIKNIDSTINDNIKFLDFDGNYPKLDDTEYESKRDHFRKDYNFTNRCNSVRATMVAKIESDRWTSSEDEDLSSPEIDQNFQLSNVEINWSDEDYNGDDFQAFTTTLTTAINTCDNEDDIFVDAD